MGVNGRGSIDSRFLFVTIGFFLDMRVWVVI